MKNTILLCSARCYLRCINHINFVAKYCMALIIPTCDKNKDKCRMCDNCQHFQSQWQLWLAMRLSWRIDSSAVRWQFMVVCPTSFVPLAHVSVTDAIKWTIKNHSMKIYYWNTDAKSFDNAAASIDVQFLLAVLSQEEIKLLEKLMKKRIRVVRKNLWPSGFSTT